MIQVTRFNTIFIYGLYIDIKLECIHDLYIYNARVYLWMYFCHFLNSKFLIVGWQYKVDP